MAAESSTTKTFKTLDLCFSLIFCDLQSYPRWYSEWEPNNVVIEKISKYDIDELLPSPFSQGLGELLFVTFVQFSPLDITLIIEKNIPIKVVRAMQLEYLLVRSVSHNGTRCRGLDGQRSL